MVPDINCFVWADGEWVKPKHVHIFHEGIGFVPIYSLKVFDGSRWRVAELSHSPEMAGV